MDIWLVDQVAHRDAFHCGFAHGLDFGTRSLSGSSFSGSRGCGCSLVFVTCCDLLAAMANEFADDGGGRVADASAAGAGGCGEWRGFRG